MPLTHDPVLEAQLRAVIRATRAGEDLVGQGLDLRPSTLVAAYRAGAFPMGLGRDGRGPMGWWSPDPRGVLRLGSLRASRSLRKVVGRFEITFDEAFDDVLNACADPRRSGRWITPTIRHAYAGLHREGIAHSVECWAGSQLAGGLYGVGIGGLFAGESMFHTHRDASKVALVALVERLRVDDQPDRVIDVQWRTDHLASLGVSETSRRAYLDLLDRAVALGSAWD